MSEKRVSGPIQVFVIGFEKFNETGKILAELRRVRKQGNEERERLRATTQKLAREMTDGARRDHGQTLQNARARLDLEAKNVRDQVSSEIPSFAQKIAERLLGRGLS